MSRVGRRTTKSELALQLAAATHELESLRRVTRETLRRLVQNREDEIRAQIRMESRAAGAKAALLSVCDAGILDSKFLEDGLRSAVMGVEGPGLRVLTIHGVQIWPPREEV